METIKKNVTLSKDALPAIFGAFDGHIKLIEDLLPSVRITAAQDGVLVSGKRDEANTAATLLEKLNELAVRGESLDKPKIRRALEMVQLGQSGEIVELSKEIVAVTARGKSIKCKTAGQRAYVNAIKKHQLVFGFGPAGTGKTYLAVAMAVTAYKRNEVERIILTRPAIEAGERLGFLPGDLQQKVDPYLRPLFDALQEMFGTDNYAKLIERGVVEIAPLAYMRGRTLSKAFIILDEAQNTTVEQMKMFLTRMGEGSKIIVNGDPSQIDLPEGKQSGLNHAVKILDGTEGIAVCSLTSADVVRHELVQRIVKAYEAAVKSTDN
ncbi:MAG: PhoH family protein [Firmicutes bacterium]|nr:PhoH family protein [Bacillota bacterium]